MPQKPNPNESTKNSKPGSPMRNQDEKEGTRRASQGDQMPKDRSSRASNDLDEDMDDADFNH